VLRIEFRRVIDGRIIDELYHDISKIVKIEK